MKPYFLTTITLAGLWSAAALAEDWTRFRGPAGTGVATESAAMVPSSWSPSANIAWKTPLPGPGASSPIIVNGKAFVTCYSGYGLDQQNPGNIDDLKRHLVCVDMASGQLLWEIVVPAVQPEDPFTGAGVPAHGYASHTPVSDGQNVYAFFGKSGVHAFDLEGNPKWQASVGMESDPWKWGSSASPILFENILIVTASCESQSIIGFDKETGEVLWRQEASGLDGMWGTPTLVKVDDDRTDLVMCVAGEMWGLDPNTGKLRWFADAMDAEHAYSSVVVDGNRAYAFTGRGGGSLAIDVGGSGDISESGTVWKGSDNASFASPVLHDGKLYVVTSGIVNVVDAATGKSTKKLRLKGARQTGGRFGSLDYASPIVVGDRMFYMNGSGQMYVFELGDEMKQVALNQVTGDTEVFWGTPAASDGKLVIRSSKHLYCVADKGETVDQTAEIEQPDDNPESQQQAGGGGRQGGRQFDPAAMFDQIDSNKDGQISETELEGTRIADRLKTLDKDDDKMISKDEFTSGISSLFNQGGGGGRAGGGRGAGRGGEPEAAPRPKRPLRPEMADAKS